MRWVRKALWGAADGTLAQPDEATMAALVRLCTEQATGPLVFPTMLSECAVPQRLQTQMKAVCAQTMQQQVKLRHTLTIAWQALTAAGISPVLMKGAGLAALYRDASLRAWSDIDLFVGKTQYHPACAVLRETFPAALTFDEELDHYKHYNLIADGVSIEVHRVTAALPHPTDDRRYARMEAYGTANGERMTVNELEVTVFEPTFNALFVFLHAWEHMLSAGACVRQLCDLALVLHQYAERIDRARLKRYLERLHLTDIWCVYMCALVEYIGLDAQEAPFYSEAYAARAERLMTDLLNGPVMEQVAEDAPQNRWLRKIHTMQQRMRDAQRIRPYSASYARHMQAGVLLRGALRLFAKDRHWE